MLFVAHRNCMFTVGFECKSNDNLLLFMSSSQLGIAPHCLDPGTVHSVTVENFCGEKWEESMQVHETIRDMSKPEENQPTVI